MPIRTWFLGPTNAKGSRIGASYRGHVVKTVYRRYDHNTGSYENHLAAANLLVSTIEGKPTELDLEQTWVGDTRTGYTFSTKEYP